MKILHQHGFNHTELLTNRQVIYRNLIDSAKCLVQYLKEFDILPANPEILVRLYSQMTLMISEKCNIFHHSLSTLT